jgi:Cu+-exporting ATPase
MKPPSSLKLIDEIVSLGYGAREIEVGGKSDNALDRLNSTEELDEWRQLFLISVAFTLPLFILQYFFLSLTDTHDIIGGITLKEVLMLFIATPMQMIVGRRFYKAAYLGYQHGVVGMDFLISLGVGGSYLNSCVVVFLQFLDPMFDKPVMFETAGMLLSFVTLGKFLEKTATGHTTAALARLAGMQPQKAIRVALDSKGLPVMNGTGEATVDVCDVQLGDCIKVLPGGAIPVDGVVLRGESYVDESMISGEPLPVAKKNKDNVFGGTINQLSILYIVANRVGEETALAQIVRLVEEAQTSKAPIQAFADRIAAIFAPMIILLSMMTFIFWIVMISGQFANPSWFEGDGSMQHMEPDELPGAFLFAFMSAIAVLVVACPCALGLATPTAVMVGTGVGAKHGVLIKGGDVLEAATKVDCIIFDKTGTLTSGKLSLSDEVHIDEACSRAANLIMGNGSKSSSSSVPLASIPLLLAASVEQASEHPIGKALTNAASANGLSTLPLRSDAKTDVLVGSGVVAALQLKKSGQSLTAAVGNVKLMKDQNISVSSDITAKVKALEEQGKTVVLVAVMNNNDKAATNGGGYAVGALALTDQLKPSANNTVRNLERNGIEVWMITGDAEAPARYTATQAGIDPNRVIAKALPETKALEVKRLQGQGKMVALIGDGINDSPALAQADVGIAIGAGTQVALEAANMVLIRDDLHGVSIALDLAKTVFFRIKLNYVWALGYNLFGVPTAAGVVMPFIHGFHLRPEIAAACMAFSSIAVVLSSLSLNLYKPPQSGVNWIEDDGVMSVIKNVISWSVDSIINQNKKGHYTRVNDFDEEEDENDEEMGGSGQVSRRSNASGGVNYGATIVPHEPNPFTD